MPDLSIEEIIRRAIQEGKFDDLPGKGEPLQLDDNPHEDPEWRAAHHILKSAGFTLPWIETLRQIESDLEAARVRFTQAWAWRQKTLAKDSEILLVESEWTRAVQSFKEQIATINDQIRSFNLGVPAERFQLTMIDPELEIEKTINAP